MMTTSQRDFNAHMHWLILTHTVQCVCVCVCVHVCICVSTVCIFKRLLCGGGGVPYYSLTFSRLKIFTDSADQSMAAKNFYCEISSS